jgi:hypothetical protein
MSDEGFLARWSRRKREAAAAPPRPEPPAAPPAAAPDAALAEPEAEFDPASLPPVESLTAESDISAFLRPQVPPALRSAALRRVWTLDPAIRDYVGPADYAWDYNAPDGMAGFSLELGGDVKRLLAQAIGLVEEVPEATAPPEATTPPEAGPEMPRLPRPGPEPEPDLQAEPDPAPVLAAAPEPVPPGPAAGGAAPAPAPVRRHGGARPA